MFIKRKLCIKAFSLISHVRCFLGYREYDKDAVYNKISAINVVIYIEAENEFIVLVPTIKRIKKQKFLRDKDIGKIFHKVRNKSGFSFKP